TRVPSAQNRVACTDSIRQADARFCHVLFCQPVVMIATHTQIGGEAAQGDRVLDVYGLLIDGSRVLERQQTSIASQIKRDQARLQTWVSNKSTGCAARRIRYRGVQDGVSSAVQTDGIDGWVGDPKAEVFRE